MPEESPLPLTPSKGYQRLDNIGDPFKSSADLLPTDAAPWPGHGQTPPKMYHPNGRFMDRSGSRFDYLFLELLENPALPLLAVARVPALLRGSGDVFYSRRMEREKDRLSIGLKYGHGDIPPRPVASRD